MMEPNLGPVVTDFGLARCLDDEGDVQLTQDGVAIGTPSYMSPEQLDGESELGPASDIFSLGLIFFEMLTGRRRFQGKVTGIIGQILTKDPAPLREIREDVDPLLDGICQKMMARKAADRYGSMAEVADVMRAYLKGQLAEPSRENVRPEMSSDPEVFFAELSTREQNHSPALSTQGGAALENTEDEFIPSIVISDEDSQSSHILQKHARPPLSRKMILWGGLGLLSAAGLAGYFISDAINTDLPAQVAAERKPPSESPQRPTKKTASQNSNTVWNAAPKTAPDAITSIENPETVVWEFSHDRPAPQTPARPPKTPAPESTPSPKPQASPASAPKAASPPPVEIKPAEGKMEFHALVEKTINGFPTKKDFKTPRLALTEIVKLDRREQDRDKALEQVRAVIGLNGNAFEFSNARLAHEAVLALEEGIRQNIPVEDVLAKWKSLNVPKTPPKITLPREEVARIEKAIGDLIATKVQPFVNGLNQGLGIKSQRDVDLAQAYFEQECRKLPGIPAEFPLPKLRVTLTPAGSTDPAAGQTLVGDSQRLQDQTPRGRLVKRIAEALTAGTLIAAPNE